MGENKQQAHRALYRKYRPKSLDEIIGQEHITTILRQAVEQNKVNHAYLFTGPRGTGKTSIARILAYAINQLDYTDDTQQLDIIEIDAASNRRIDDIRELREKVHIAPVNAAYKVYIIDEVHMLTPESFNALLKTLEEPPSHVIFILATTEIQKLPATILSRVQRHNFRLIDEAKITKHLANIAKQEGLKIDTGALELLAKHGGGSFRDSISLLDQLSSHGGEIDEAYVRSLLGVAPQELINKLLETLESTDHTAILSCVEELIASGLTATGIAAELTSTLRGAIYKGEEKSYYLDLMEQLLGVAGAPYKQLKLESILLRVSWQQPEIKPETKEKPRVVAQQVTQTKKVDAPAPVTKSPVKKKPDEAEAKPEEKTDDQPAPRQKTSSKNQEIGIQSDVIESWQEILDATKVKHNPLYTLLRVGTPEMKGSTLTLSFAFGFHKKKLEDPKYKALLAQTVQEITKQSVEIESKVDEKKGASKQPEHLEDSAHASQISAVRDMMGGGDIVNV